MFGWFRRDPYPRCTLQRAVLFDKTHLVVYCECSKGEHIYVIRPRKESRK